MSRFSERVGAIAQGLTPAVGFSWISILSIAGELLNSLLSGCLTTPSAANDGAFPSADEVAERAKSNESLSRIQCRQAVRISAQRQGVRLRASQVKAAADALFNETQAPDFVETVRAASLDFQAFGADPAATAGDATFPTRSLRGWSRGEQLQELVDKGYRVCVAYDLGDATDGEVKAVVRKMSALWGGKFPDLLKDLSDSAKSSVGELRRLCRVLDVQALDLSVLNQENAEHDEPDPAPAVPDEPGPESEPVVPNAEHAVPGPGPADGAAPVVPAGPGNDAGTDAGGGGGGSSQDPAPANGDASSGETAGVDENGQTND